MQRQKVTEEDSLEMNDICLNGYQGHRNAKSFKHICGLFLKHFIEDRPKKSEQVPITIFVCSSGGERGGNQSGQSFIMGCLVYLFLRFRYLKITFEVGSKAQPKSPTDNISLSFSNSGVAMIGDFYKKIAGFIQKKSQEYRQSFNFFGDICFKLKESPQSKKNAGILRLRSYLFVGEFYRQLNAVLSNKSIYLMKNLLFGFQNGDAAELEYFQKIISQVRKMFVLVQVWVNVPIKTLMLLADQPHTRQTCQLQQKPAHSGVFKQFEGTTLDYLQKLVLVIKGEAQQIACVAQLLQKTPNLSFLELHNRKSEEIQLLGMERLLQSIIENTPLIQKVNLVKFRMQNIEEELLHRLYINCPFLIELSLGIVFEHSIIETYQLQNSQNKQTIELQRSKQLILQAMRLRNITLKNSEETAKLLLKKGYSFFSALQIIDCIEPVCL